MSESKSKYFVAFTPQSNKDYDSLAILSTCNTKSEAEQVLTEICQLDLKKLKECKLKVCGKCEDSDLCNGDCYNMTLGFTSFEEDEVDLYKIPMSDENFSDAGISVNYEGNDGSIFWIIKIPKDTKRGEVVEELRNMIL